MDRSGNQRCWKNNTLLIYLSHVLSSWGDRMWQFAVGLYLVMLYPQSLKLTALYGFASCTSIIILGAVIGKWIDKTKRISVAQTALIVQNGAVVVCSSLMIVLLYYDDDLDKLWNGSLEAVLVSLVIFVAVIANLGSEASKIALEKDWIVVLAGGDQEKLSKMNATMRSINLTTFILAPILVGQILTFGSKIMGAGFIAGWNVCSCILEYYLLTNIYKRIPQLANKNIPLIEVDSPAEAPLFGSSKNETEVDPVTPRDNNNDLFFDDLTEVSLVTPKGSSPNLWNSNKVHPLFEEKSKPASCCDKTVQGFTTKVKESWIGWKDYFASPVRNAGVGLALLYMTVLGFDSITTGFAYSQGVSESLLGIMTAIGAGFGILGSVLFPYLRNKLGKCSTGNIGFGCETCCLVLCLVSIFTAGSPFIYNDLFTANTIGQNGPETSLNYTSGRTTEVVPINKHTTFSLLDLWNSKISIVLLMSGIISARFGLWIADLSVLQIFQEEIPEHKRGVLNGVQGALNQSMNLLKFIIVMILPHPDTFAYLIVLSWLFVFSGWLCFIVFSWQQRRRSRLQLLASSCASAVSGPLS